MALLFVDPFCYSTNEITKKYGLLYYAGVVTIETSGGPYTGDRFMQFSYAASIVAGRAIGSIQTICMQVKYKVDNYAGYYVCPIALFDGLYTTPQIKVMDRNQIIQVYRGGNWTLGSMGTLLGTANKIPYMNSWNQLELKCKIDSTTGSVLLKLNGQTVLNLTNINTQETLNAYCTHAGYGTPGGTGDVKFGVAHAIMMDTTGSYCNDLLGNRRVQAFMPTGDGNYKQWTPSTGTDHYALVDEIPPSATDYNESAAAGNKDTFTHGSIGNTNASVDAAVIESYCKTNDGGAATMRGIARRVTTDVTTSSLPIPASENYLQFPVYTDPVSALPFTAAQFNACEFGVERDS